jgi:Ca2+-binding EF-hand superfamily protein
MDTDGDGRVQLAEFRASSAAALLDGNKLDALYAEADLNNDQGIDYREFVVILVLVWLLRPQQAAGAGATPAGGACQEALTRLTGAMETLLAAWAFMDKDNSGSIDRDEVDKALGTDDAHMAPSQRAAPGRQASLSRFREMDVSSDGRVTFPEFVLAVESWAGVGDDE